MEGCALGWQASGVIGVELGADIGQKLGVDVGAKDVEAFDLSDRAIVDPIDG